MRLLDDSRIAFLARLQAKQAVDGIGRGDHSKRSRAGRQGAPPDDQPVSRRSIRTLGCSLWSLRCVRIRSSDRASPARRMALTPSSFAWSDGLVVCEAAPRQVSNRVMF